MLARILALLFPLSLWSAAMADDPRFRLRIESTVERGQLTVSPEVTGPSGAALRYELVSSKTGGAGKSTTRQSGRVGLGPGGQAKLATLRLGVGPKDRYAITVTVFDGKAVVAEESLSYPP
jgi:hypothetical protein